MKHTVTLIKVHILLGSKTDDDFDEKSYIYESNNSIGSWLLTLKQTTVQAHIDVKSFNQQKMQISLTVWTFFSHVCGD